MNEDSMVGRLFWEYFRHRIEEGRTLSIIEDNGAENYDLTNVRTFPFPLSVSERS